MSNKGSDKNVGSMEDDIKILENMIEEYENCSVPEIDMQVNITFRERQADAIQNILSNYRRQKEMNEEHQKINGELREKVKELEEEKALLKKASNIAKEVNIEDVTDVINESCKEFMSNYIPKQVIIDKIKEYDKKMEEDAGHPNWVITDRIVINVLQELLGGERNELER